ncbi:transcriptional SWT1 isoform X1 [Brachionus plicatilis]|uniref:Transcriptional SWT1 isoform X1 n=1 Tax=Brachionus plicatilis TaxID=10195 RepID=A0A3M7RKA8_BRAPC|nr:transcriptional SWT1 isoform X1 [Brachionus plicatilis]
MDEEFKNLLKNWKQCFSQSKQRHYYFNPKTGESLWTLEETSTINDDVIMKDSIEYDDYGTDAMDVEIAADIQNFRNDLCLTKTDFNNLIQIPNEEEFDYNFEIEFILILDTNIFISHLEKLKDLSTLDPTKFVFYVPWVVVQELDNLKIKKSIEQFININQKAKEAIRFIHSLLDSKKSNFYFENFNKSNILIDGFSLKTNDDKILNTALRIFKENSKKRCILVTNDINLINKQKELVYDPLFEKFASGLASIIHDRLICSNTKVLSHFFEMEMIKAYDDLWKKINDTLHYSSVLKLGIFWSIS